LKPSSISLPALSVVLATAAICAFGQNAQPAAAPSPAGHHHPAPTNLKVLPKDMTGDQVHDLMHDWEAELGVTCKTCHAANPKDIGPNGRPRLNYADDSREEKRTARLMYQMLDTINGNYIAKIDSSGLPVTCGTCHQGHLSPEPYSAEDRPRTHASVPAASKPAAGR